MIDATTGVHCGAVAWPLAARARRAFRRSELVALDVADLEETEDGFKIIIRRSEANVALCVAAQIVPMMVATIPHSHLRDFLDQRVTDGVIRLNNLRILSLSFDGFVSRYAGMPFPKETLAFSDEPNKLMAVMERTDYRVWQDWKQFSVPGATVIAQSSFWLENCTNEETFEMYINGTTIPR